MNLSKGYCKICKNFEYGKCVISDEPTDENWHCNGCEITLGTIMSIISNHNGIRYNGQITGHEMVLRKQVNNQWCIINKVTGDIKEILAVEAAAIITNLHKIVEPNYKLIYEL